MSPESLEEMVESLAEQIVKLKKDNAELANRVALLEAKGGWPMPYPVPMPVPNPSPISPNPNPWYVPPQWATPPTYGTPNWQYTPSTTVQG